MISLIRVDERVIHGQTTVHLTKQYPCDGILIVDDTIAKDAFMMQVYKSVLPGTAIKVIGFTVEQAVRKLPEAERSAKNYYVVFKRPTTVRQLLQAGYTIKDTVFIGPQGVRPGTTNYGDVMCNLTADESAALDYAVEHGVKVIVDPRFFSPNQTWQSIRNK